MWSKYEVFYIYDKPVPYKKLMIYPVELENYLYFHYYANVFMLDKNSVPDVNVISMNYLDYIYYATDKENPHILMLDALLKMCLRPNTPIAYEYDENKKAIFIVDGEKYNANDFEEIRKIICEQNMLELPDENIQKEVRDKMREAEELKRKINNQKMGSLEDQIICIMISTPMKLEDIYKLTIRKFVKTLQRVDHKLHYQIYLSASMSGLVEFKDKSFIKHWMVDLDKTKDENDALIEVQEMKDKINFNDKKNS